MDTTNRRWQNHLRAKGVIPFLLDRFQAHALSFEGQHGNGPFHFPIDDQETDDELTRSYFDFAEDFPYELYIEMSNNCNLNCVMCARTAMTRELGIIDDALFRKIIDEISEKQPHAFIHYYGIGESMLDKKIFNKLAYARSKGLHNSLLFTNGQLLSHKDNCKKLADSGVTNIGIDVDAMSPEIYEKIRIGGDYGKLRDGIAKLYEYVRSGSHFVRIELAYNIYPGINDHELGTFVEWCVRNSYEYKIVTMHNWAGLRDDVPQSSIEGLKEMHHSDRKNPCTFLWNGFMISWDGKVPVCFQDADVQDCIGDINEQTIEEVWQSGHFKKRREQVHGIFSGLCEQCSACTSFSLPAFGSSLYPESLRKPS